MPLAHGFFAVLNWPRLKRKQLRPIVTVARCICGGMLLTCANSIADVVDDAQPDNYLNALITDAPHLETLLIKYPYLKEYLLQDRWRRIQQSPYFLPGGRWRVHDIRRPQPAQVISVATQETAILTPPPEDAIRLFDGRNLDEWKGEFLDKWRIQNGILISSGTEYNLIETRRHFRDVQLHIEWASPDPPQGTWQYRGNSGVFFHGLYEVQILDSWENPTFPDGQAGAIFGQIPPSVNAALPAGEWQSFDIVFETPLFRDSDLVKPATITVLHNGILIHNHEPILGITDFASEPHYEPHSPAGSIMLQDHGGPGSRVRFRNIWVRTISAEKTH